MIYRHEAFLEEIVDVYIKMQQNALILNQNLFNMKMQKKWKKSANCMASEKMPVYVQFNLARLSIIKKKSFDPKINLKLKFIKYLELEAMIVRNLNGSVHLCEA